MYHNTNQTLVIDISACWIKCNKQWRTGKASFFFERNSIKILVNIQRCLQNSDQKRLGHLQFTYLEKFAAGIKQNFQ